MSTKSKVFFGIKGINKPNTATHKRISRAARYFLATLLVMMYGTAIFSQEFKDVATFVIGVLLLLIQTCDILAGAETARTKAEANKLDAEAVAG